MIKHKYRSFDIIFPSRRGITFSLSASSPTAQRAASADSIVDLSNPISSSLFPPEWACAPCFSTDSRTRSFGRRLKKYSVGRVHRRGSFVFPGCDKLGQQHCETEVSLETRTDRAESVRLRQ